jgi:hypothetical protein
MHKEKYLLIVTKWVNKESGPKLIAYRKKDCVAGSAHFLFTSSVVVTLVQVMQSDTTCPMIRAQTKRFVQRLINRAQTLFVNNQKDV